MRPALALSAGLGDPAIVDGELLEIGQDGQRKFGRPGIAAKLIGRTEIVLQIDGWLLGFEEELPAPPIRKQ